MMRPATARIDTCAIVYLYSLRYRGYNESHLCGFYKSHCPDGATDCDGSGCKSHHPIRRTMMIARVSKCRHASRSVESALLTPPWILDGNFGVLLINEKFCKIASSAMGNCRPASAEVNSQTSSFLQSTTRHMMM